MTVLTIGVLFGAAFFGRTPLGEPRLRIEFYPPPPWQVGSGYSFEVSIGIANDAWLLAWAKNISVVVLMPEGFISSLTGTDECVIYFGSLHGGDGLGGGLTITVSGDVSPGNYTITIRVQGDNVDEKIFTSHVTVLAHTPQTITMSYTEFNSLTATDHDLKKDQNVSWRVEILSRLTYNASGIHQATVRLADDTDASADCVYVVMYTDGTLQIAWKAQTLYHDGNSWNPSDAITVVMTEDYLSVHNGTKYVVDKFPLSGWTLVRLSALGGGDDAGVATAGYVGCVVDRYLSPVERAALYLATEGSVYNPTLRLCIESPKTFKNRYWTTSDNLWAYKALQPHYPSVANAIKDKLKELVTTYNLPHDSEGLPISYKHEVVLGVWQYIQIPFNLSTAITLYHDGYNISADIQNSTSSWPDFEEYADALCYASLTRFYQNKPDEAEYYFDKAKAMWDGMGLADKAYHGTGVYETYKLGLLLHTSKTIGRPLGFERELSQRIWRQQGPYTDGIRVNYYPDGTPIDDTNTETTAIVIIANPDPP
ncbi:MAG: hypothetical protein ACE5Z5_11695 [Candidatus Bathyarchaeia archaeon]